ncbi:hypothetical protein A2U01_0049829, partial [Trifolium medium]|nr:hypothetical protein [Trifolium medium]
KSDRVRRCSVPTPVKRRGLCTCKCSDAQVSESEANVFRVLGYVPDSTARVEYIYTPRLGQGP